MYEQVDVKHHLFLTFLCMFIRAGVWVCVHVRVSVVSGDWGVLVWTGACWSLLMLVINRAEWGIFLVGGNYSQLWNAGHHDGLFFWELKIQRKSSNISLWESTWNVTALTIFGAVTCLTKSIWSWTGLTDSFLMGLRGLKVHSGNKIVT